MINFTTFSLFNKCKQSSRLFVLLLLFATCQPVMAAEQIVVWGRTFDNPAIMDVLKLALEQNPDVKKSYSLVRSSEMEQGRVMRELKKKNTVDIAAFAPTPERELQAIAIRIPVSKGLLGYRVCLVREGEENNFKNIMNLNDWTSRRLRIGQGTDWPDTAILEFNGIEVEKSVEYQPLFHMLRKNRFDCFARSVNEVFSELARPENSSLRIDNHLMLQYRLPTFFFVNKNKPELAKRIEKGLKSAIENGSFSKLFEKHYAATLKRIDFNNRRVIKLENPNLSKATKLMTNTPELWLNPLN